MTKKIPVSEVPHLASRWDYTRNNDLGLTPEGTPSASKSKMYWLCGNGHDHSSLASPAYIKKSEGCPVCYGRQVWPGFNDFASMNPGRAAFWDYSKNDNDPEFYTASSNKKAWFTCERGHSFNIGLNSVALGRWCRYCARNVTQSGVNDIASMRPDLLDIWDENLNVDPEVQPDNISVASHQKVYWKCRDYSHSWLSSISYVATGGGCSVCAGRQVLAGFNDFASKTPSKAKFWDYTKNEDRPENVAANSGKYFWFTCENSHEFRRNLCDITSNGFWCPYCSGKIADPSTCLAAVYPDLVCEWSPENSKTPYEVLPFSSYRATWVCKDDSEHTWAAYVYSRTGKFMSGCPSCNRPGSKAQYEISSIIRSYLPDCEVFDDYVGLCRGKQQVDIYIKDLNIALEYNGLVWHSDNPKIKPTPTHDKFVECQKNGVDLFVIWEDDWLNNREIVLKWLLRLIGKSEDAKLNARSCYAKLVGCKDSNEFLQNNHIQGPKNGSIRVGLYDGEDLVALAVYSRTGGKLSLERYATSCNVRGGFSKLQTWIDRNIEYTSMITFADLTYSRGNLYIANGWHEDRVLDPDYSYIERNKRNHKFGYRLKNFRNDTKHTGERKWKYEEGMTEHQLAHLNGLWRVYDCGKIRYVRNNPNSMIE